ncbi:MAG: Uma2 family endonuclease [Bacteroidota bacterium]
MNVETKFPVTAFERAELGEGIVRFPASWEEYLDLLEEAEYQIEYDNQEIITMSIASDPHETLVSTIIRLLGNAVDDLPDMTVKGSNRHVFIPEFRKDYAPDAHVVKGAPKIHTLRKGLTANLNPWLVVEVLSPSTREHDWNDKLPHYKKIPSLRHIIYIEQDRTFISVYNRIGDSSKWENVDYDQMDDFFIVAGQPIYVRDVYKKVLFMPGSPAKK